MRVKGNKGASSSFIRQERKLFRGRSRRGKELTNKTKKRKEDDTRTLSERPKAFPAESKQSALSEKLQPGERGKQRHRVG